MPLEPIIFGQKHPDGSRLEQPDKPTFTPNPVIPLEPPKRKIIQISSSGILCNDGSIWTLGAGEIGWIRLPDVPQD